jgi:hypothetical protein
MTRARRIKIEITVRATNASGTGPSASINVQWR